MNRPTKNKVGGAIAAVQLRAAVARKIVAGAGIAAVAMSATNCANPLESELNDLKTENGQLKGQLATLQADKNTAEQNLDTAQAQLAQKNTMLNVAEWLYEKEADGTTNKRKRYTYPRTAGDTHTGTLSPVNQNKFMNEALNYWKLHPNATEQEIKSNVNSTLFHPVNDEIVKVTQECLTPNLV